MCSQMTVIKTMVQHAPTDPSVRTVHAWTRSATVTMASAVVIALFRVSVVCYKRLLASDLNTLILFFEFIRKK